MPSSTFSSCLARGSRGASHSNIPSYRTYVPPPPAAPRDAAPSASSSTHAPWLRWYIPARPCRPFGRESLPPLAGPWPLGCDLTLGCLLLGKRGQGESWEGQKGRGLCVILKQGEASIFNRKQEAILQATSESRDSGFLSASTQPSHPKSQTSRLFLKQGSGLGIADVRIQRSLELWCLYV